MYIGYWTLNKYYYYYLQFGFKKRISTTQCTYSMLIIAVGRMRQRLPSFPVSTLLCLPIHLAIVPEISTSWYQYPFSLSLSLSLDCVFVAETWAAMWSVGSFWMFWMSCPAEIPPDEVVFHRRESCPLENFYVSHFVLPSDLHD